MRLVVADAGLEGRDRRRVGMYGGFETIASNGPSSATGSSRSPCAELDAVGQAERLGVAPRRRRGPRG